MRLREYLRANMFDGDESGTVTHPIPALLDEIVELVTAYLNDTFDPDSAVFGDDFLAAPKEM